jgi:hypothetical protein
MPQDGNLRVASLVASIPLMVHSIAPVFIPKSIRKEYNEVLTRVGIPRSANARGIEQFTTGVRGSTQSVRRHRAQGAAYSYRGGGEYVMRRILRL